ncbi:MAG: EF-Tu/IF-2/RF-3 family GTPase, partial [Spirochaetota bacterium]
SLKNKGVQQLLDGVALYLPSPGDVPPLQVPKVGDKKSKNKNLEASRLVELLPHASAPLAALVFKVQYHKEMGMLCYVRIYSGTLKANGNVFNVRKGARERVNRLIQMHANSHNPVSELKAGEIGVAVGFKLARTGDTICEANELFLLESMDFPEPVISIALELQSSSDGDKLSLALEHLEREDPTFQVKESSDTGQILLSGMGELHLEVLCRRLRDEFKLGFRTGKPRVAHREALQSACEGLGRFDHEIAGVQQEISVGLELRPIGMEEVEKETLQGNNRFRNDCAELPEEYVRLIEASTMRHLATGFRLGYPAINVEATLQSCHYSAEEVYEPGFEAAVAYAIDQAVQGQETLLLEPVMKLTVMTPSEYVGDVISQLTQRHGQVHSMDSQPSCDVIHATAPLAKLFGYSTLLRSQTQGRGSFSLEFDHFAACV